MRIKLSGEKDGQQKTIVYDLYDAYDSFTQTSSMARTTGYSCTAAANLIIQNLFTEKGVFPPELVGKNKDCFEFMINYMAERKVIYRKTEY
jgi:lysine 6-dehydrogenase